MANWNNPTATSNYLNFVTEVKDRDVDLALQFDGVSPTGLPQGAIRWNSSVNRWQKWNGTSWAELTSTYALTTITATGSVTGTAFIPSGSSVPTNGTYLPSANTLGFATTSAVRGVIDSTGRWLIGSTSNSGSTNSLLQIRPTSGASAAQDAVLISHDNMAGVTINSYRGDSPLDERSILNLSGSRGTASSPTIVGFQDRLGVVRFRGYDGTAFAIGAEMRGIIDGTPSLGYIPTAISFSTSPSAGVFSERLRITSGGNLLMGGATTTVPGFGNTDSGAAYEYGKCLFVSRSNNDAPPLSVNVNFNTANTTVMPITIRRNGIGVGSVTHSNATGTTSYNSTSDYRVKENVTGIIDPILRLKQLRPVQFNFIGCTCTIGGFLAHEVSPVVPEAVTGSKDAVDDNGAPVYQQFDPSKLVPLLTAAIQDAIARIEALEAQIT